LDNEREDADYFTLTPYQLNTEKTASQLNWEAVIIFMPFSYKNIAAFLIDK